MMNNVASTEIAKFMVSTSGFCILTTVMKSSSFATEFLKSFLENIYEAKY